MPAAILVMQEMDDFRLNAVTGFSWFSLIYLISMGSIAAYSAYVWLLNVRPATQVSTYAYVNPVVAVLLGVIFCGRENYTFSCAGSCYNIGKCVVVELICLQKEAGCREGIAGNKLSIQLILILRKSVLFILLIWFFNYFLQ